ncbi:MAG: hypothetical protein ABIN58_06275 [candidate division WOR-3 bacterium]
MVGCSSRDWTFTDFITSGFSSASNTIYKIGAENQRWERCDYQWYKRYDTGWVVKYYDVYVQAGSQGPFMNCTTDHLYESDTFHNWYDPGKGINEFRHSVDGP